MEEWGAAARVIAQTGYTAEEAAKVIARTMRATAWATWGMMWEDHVDIIRAILKAEL